MVSIDLPQPNSIVFRLPDDDEDNPVFAEVMLNADGTLCEDAESFGVDIDDGFNDMEFSTIVLTRRESDDDTIELGSFDITDKLTGEPAVIFENMDLLNAIIPSLIATYNSSAGRTLQ